MRRPYEVWWSKYYWYQKAEDGTIFNGWVVIFNRSKRRPLVEHDGEVLELPRNWQPVQIPK